jgi:hypothetical protein
MTILLIHHFWILLFASITSCQLKYDYTSDTSFWIWLFASITSCQVKYDYTSDTSFLNLIIRFHHILSAKVWLYFWYIIFEFYYLLPAHPVNWDSILLNDRNKHTTWYLYFKMIACKGYNHNTCHIFILHSTEKINKLQ